MSGLSRSIWVSVLLVFSLLDLTPTPVPAAEPRSSLVVVLDGSGSMWGRIGAETKIVAAKKVMRDVLKDVPDDVEVGFVAYGHRRKGDCNDIEILAPLGMDMSSIAVAVEHIQPTGRTPITTALRQAADLFTSGDRPSTLVLVSDGIETCQGDPCALAKELKMQGAKLVIHTVGFGVDAAAAQQLQCVAQAGGGNYYDAKDSGALRQALFSVRQAIIENKPASKPVVAEPPKAEPPKSKVIKIAGPGTIKLKPAAWVKLPVYYWKAVDPETAEEKGQAKADQMRVKGGEYQIVWRESEHRHSEVPLSAIVQVQQGATVEVPIDTGLKVSVPAEIKPPYRWQLWRIGEKQPVASFANTLDPQVVPAGRYELVWRQTEHRAKDVRLGTVEVEPGKLNEVEPGGRLRVVAANWVPGQPYYFKLVDDQGQDAGWWRDFGVQLAPSGTYRLIYRQSEHGHTEVLWGAVTIPEKGMSEVQINSGVSFKPPADTKPPYKAFFINLDTKEEHVWRGGSQWQPVPLPPGRYKLDWWEKEHATKRMTLVDEFTIESGTLVELQM